MKRRTWMILVALVVLIGCAKQATQFPEQTRPVQPQARVESPKPIEIQQIPIQEAAKPVIAQPLSFENVYFAYDRYELTPAAMDILAGHAAKLKSNPDVKILIEGHCDERGTIEYNLALGEKRAQIAKDYLVRYGIASSRISTISYGKERPLELGHDDSAWSVNRRAAFVIAR